MAEATDRPKFERGNSIQSFRRTLSQMSSKSVEDTEAIPEFKVSLLHEWIISNYIDYFYRHYLIIY